MHMRIYIVLGTASRWRATASGRCCDSEPHTVHGCNACASRATEHLIIRDAGRGSDEQRSCKRGMESMLR